MKLQETQYTFGRMKSKELLITHEGLMSLMNSPTDDGRDFNIGISKGLTRDQWLTTHEGVS